MADPTKKRLLTDKEISLCETYSGLGLTVQDMAALVGVSKKTFERRMHDQTELADALLKGRAKADSQVVQSAFKQAISGKSPAMTIFWLKCRKGWKELITTDEDPEYEVPETLKE